MSHRTTTQTHGVALPQRLKGHARRNRDLYAALPHPDEGPWRAHEVLPHPAKAAALARYEIIREVAEYGPGLDRTNGRRWRTDRDAYRALERAGLLDPDRPPLYGSGNDPACPECGRCAFRNLDGERLECKPCGHVGDKREWSA